MTKILDKLWEKTQKSPNGYAFHKGRRSYWGGHKGPLEKVWEMELDDDIFQIMDKENKETPPFLVKQEYQALLGLPYQQKFIKVLQMLGYKHTKLLENVK